MHAESFIQQLGAELKLRQLQFNENDVCRLVINGQLAVDLAWLDADRELHLSAVLAERIDFEGTVYRELLAANLWGQATGGAVLALDPQRNELVLQRCFDLEMLEMRWFVQHLEQFVETVKTWKATLQGEAYTDSSELAESAEDAPPAEWEFRNAPGMLRV